MTVHHRNKMLFFPQKALSLFPREGWWLSLFFIFLEFTFGEDRCVGCVLSFECSMKELGVEKKHKQGPFVVSPFTFKL